LALLGQGKRLPWGLGFRVEGSALLYTTLIYSTLLYSTLSYSILFYSILFYSTLCYSTLLYYTLLYSTLLYSIPFYSTLLYPTLLYFTLLCSAWLCSTSLYFTFLYFTLLSLLYFTRSQPTHLSRVLSAKLIDLSQVISPPMYSENLTVWGLTLGSFCSNRFAHRRLIPKYRCDCFLLSVYTTIYTYVNNIIYVYFASSRKDRYRESERL
jgi:hypothetical protein